MRKARNNFCLVLLVIIAFSEAAATPPASPVFYKTHNSDEWVNKTFRIQKRYRRVLLVDNSQNAPRTIRVAALDLNAVRNGHTKPGRSYFVGAVFKTLQEAADACRGGDLVAVMPGTYAGFVVGDKSDAADGRYIHFKAMGKPGDVVIDRGSERDPDWMVLLQAAHHVIVEGFNIAGRTGPGRELVGPRAGIMLDGDFGSSGKQTHHIAIVGNFSHNHRKWGLHSTDTHSVLIEDNLFALSAQEHSAYASDGSDNYVIRRNIFFGSNAGGLQCNIDSVSSFHELLKHPALRNYRKEEPTRDWAVGLVKLATEKFGENNFPDGRGINFIIEDNVVNANGKAGGGSLNLAGLQDSLIQNNLLYGNFNHGIAQWDDANPYDERYVEPGPQSPDQVTGPEALPLWGCHSNLIRNNTVLMNNKGRAAMQCRNGSWGTVMRNNIFINDQPSSIEIFNTSIFRLDSRFNVINTLSYTGMPDALKRLALALPEGANTTSGVTRERAAGEFVRYGEEPWVIIEGNWWRLNPNRPDFRPKAASKLLARRGDATQLPAHDLYGEQNRRPFIGALSPAVASNE
ncbi:MAG: right-handed parallel beta-helix repeat-containing protein [Acidobacteriota bacterium]|nr:right-handed parallel beta-helix repeat-containing protein [Acidobacteriota bacterium]